MKPRCWWRTPSAEQDPTGRKAFDTRGKTLA
jgi:hypothetical protein